MDCDNSTAFDGSKIDPRILPAVVTDPNNFISSTGQILTAKYTENDYVLTACTQDDHIGGVEIAAMIFGIAIFLTNLIVVAAIHRGGRKLHKATFYCICNLALADMLAGLLLLWIFGLQRVVLPFRTPYAELVQKGIWTLTVWSSLLSQVVIAIDRYSHVTRTVKGDSGFPRANQDSKWGNKHRRRLVMIGILLTWLIPAITFVIPVMTVWNCMGQCSCYFANHSTRIIYMICAPVSSCSQVNPPFSKTSMLFMSLVLILLPLVPVVLYAKIFIFVRNSSKNLRPSSSSKNYKGHANDADHDRNRRAGAGDGAHRLKEDSSESKTEALLSHDEQQHVVSIASIQLKTDGQTKKDGNKNVSKKRQDVGKSRLNRSSILRRQEHSRKETTCENGSKQDSARHQGIYKSKSSKRLGSSSSALRKRSQSRDMRLLRTLVIILALFVVSTVPLGVLFLISVTETDKRYVNSAKTLLTLSLLNSLVNPWVYFWRFHEMRQAIKQLFCIGKGQRKLVKNHKAKFCLCCHLAPPRNKTTFASTHSNGKKASTSKDQSSSSVF